MFLAKKLHNILKDYFICPQCMVRWKDSYMWIDKGILYIAYYVPWDSERLYFERLTTY